MNENDLITLNAYIDGELTQSERDAFDLRLQNDPLLRQQVESYKSLKLLLSHADRVKIPRNFTLDPALYSRKKSFFSFLIPSKGQSPVVLAASLILSLILWGSGLMTLFGNFASGMPGVAMEAAPPPMADEASVNEMESAEEMEPMLAMEAPAAPDEEMDGATKEQPAEDSILGLGEFQGTPNPTMLPEISGGGGFGEQSESEPLTEESMVAASGEDTSKTAIQEEEMAAQSAAIMEDAIPAERSFKQPRTLSIVGISLIIAAVLLMVYAIFLLLQTKRIT